MIYKGYPSKQESSQHGVESEMFKGDKSVQSMNTTCIPILPGKKVASVAWYTTVRVQNGTPPTRG